MIYNQSMKGPFKVSGVHDKNERRQIGLLFRPYQWISNKVYYRFNNNDYDVVVPNNFNGYYYKVKSPGKSGNSEPVWGVTTSGETRDGTNGLIWETVNYNLLVPTENITNVVCIANNSVSITNVVFTNIDCKFMIEPITTQISDFEVNCHVTKSNLEEFDVTLKFIIGVK